MGLEIDRIHVSAEDAERFAGRLADSLRALEVLLARPGFGAGSPTLGAELEVSLIDDQGRPLPLNKEVLAESVDPRLTVELDRFNLESNLHHGPLAGAAFTRLRAECEGALAEMERAAGLHGARVAMIGILPTLRPSDLQADAMTESLRYRALSENLRRLRSEPFSLSIHGEDPLEMTCPDVTYEGAATSFQVHLRVDPRDFAAVYNGIQLATPLVLALAGNSPTFLGHRLWEETRIALFKQAVDHRPNGGREGALARVSFGEGWCAHPLELFRESVTGHAPLLHVLSDQEPLAVLEAGDLPELAELRLHQGTVWRWNRAIFDPAEGGHLRVELRTLPSGPSVEDMLANAAFHIGLGLALAERGADWIRGVDFDVIHRDFYRAAREGVAATLHWPDPDTGALEARRVPELACAQVELAQRGLDRAGVDSEESRALLATVERRARQLRSGAAWQRRRLAELGATRSRDEALAAMLGEYLRHGATGRPVDSWPESAP